MFQKKCVHMLNGGFFLTRCTADEMNRVSAIRDHAFKDVEVHGRESDSHPGENTDGSPIDSPRQVTEGYEKPGILWEVGDKQEV